MGCLASEATRRTHSAPPFRRPSQIDPGSGDGVHCLGGARRIFPFAGRISLVINVCTSGRKGGWGDRQGPWSLQQSCDKISRWHLLGGRLVYCTSSRPCWCTYPSLFSDSCAASASGEPVRWFCRFLSQPLWQNSQPSIIGARAAGAVMPR